MDHDTRQQSIHVQLQIASMKSGQRLDKEQIPVKIINIHG
jgi:hypothetical protein